jgi:uncharacterized protein (TIGR02284 family)
MNNQQTIESLNLLLAACRDGHDGFLKAAEVATSPELKSTLGRFGIERGEFAQAIAGEIERLGGKPHGHGTVAGWFHRGWFELKSKVGRSPESALLQACEKGEGATVGHFESELEKEFPDETRALIEQQMVRIFEVRETIRGFAARD